MRKTVLSRARCVWQMGAPLTPGLITGEFYGSWHPARLLVESWKKNGRQTMTGNETQLFSRRELARAAMFGGASALLGSAALGATGAPPGGELLDARKLGAAGDGKTDDTLALQRAFDAAAVTSGGVFVPPGVY